MKKSFPKPKRAATAGRGSSVSAGPRDKGANNSERRTERGKERSKDEEDDGVTVPPLGLEVYRRERLGPVHGLAGVGVGGRGMIAQCRVNRGRYIGPCGSAASLLFAPDLQSQPTHSPPPPYDHGYRALSWQVQTTMVPM